MKSASPLSRCALLSLIIFLANAPCESHAQQPASPPGPEGLLPADKAAMDVMQLTVPPRLEELTKKLQRAAAKDPDWWRAHVQKAKPGEPLPYDARLGLTKEEYEELLDLSKKMTLKKVKVIEMSVKRDGKRVVLNFGDGLPNLKEIELDLKADTVTTPFGVAADRSRITASEGQKATGPWNGVQWKLEKIEEKPARTTLVKFALGKLKDSGRGILYYDVKQVSEDAKVVFYYVLQYDLKRDR